jgi:hypothetical protein
MAKIPPLPPDSHLVIASRKEFSAWLGLFYVVWSGAEVVTAYAVGKFLSLAHEETHLLTARMEFARKTALLRALISRSDHPKKAALKGALNKMQNESKRNVFAHSFLRSDLKTVTFVERTWEGDFKVRLHKFTLEEFIEHVERFQVAGREFERALGMTDMDKDFQAFCFAADAIKTTSKA